MPLSIPQLRLAESQLPTARQQTTHKVHGLLLLVIGGVMLASGFLPWVIDPLGAVFTGWLVPVDLGWQLRFNLVNYGLLCAASAALALLQSYAFWYSVPRKSSLPPLNLLQLGLICLLPNLLFYLQYLFVDVYAMDVLVQHKLQALLIHQHFTYRFSSDLIQLQPLQISSSSLLARMEILIDQLAVGQLLPLLCGWLLISWHFLSPVLARPTRRRRYRGYWLVVAVIVLCLLGRAPLATLCDVQAKNRLLEGNYQSALHWLDAAASLNPAFAQVPYYHVQRGWAWYFLRPTQENLDILSYLSSVYLQQGNLAGAYQDELVVQNLQNTSPSWSIAEQSLVFTNLAETLQQQSGPAMQRLELDQTALPWLQDLIATDYTNVYGHYATGLIEYNQHDYTSCIRQMLEVTRFTTNSDIQSWAYAYIGLSEEALGNPVAGRNFLFKAETLDPLYHNALAREELSGLH